MPDLIQTKIEGVLSIPLRKIPDERGSIMHMLRCDAPHFDKFGEIYFSTVYSGVVKAWHLHTRMTQNYAVVAGMIKLVLYDTRDASPTFGALQEFFLGEENYVLLRIPPGVCNGFKGLGEGRAIVANCTTEPHDASELQRFDPSTPKIPYDWSLKHG